MGKTPEYSSNILAKLQQLQDLYSKHYRLSVALYDGEGARFLIPSSYGMTHCQTCAKGEAFCQCFFDKLFLHVKNQASSLLMTCPFGLSAAFVPLGLSLETNMAAQPDYYLLSGKIKLSGNDAGAFSEEAPQPTQHGEITTEEFQEITQIIASNLEMILGLIKMGGIPLKQKTAIKKEDYARLTQREKEILHLVSIGMSNQEIGNSLFISDHTVKVHISNILRKLQLNNRIKLALYEIQAL